MIFLYLLLAHLLADFVLQPEKLVRWKQQAWGGIAVHGLVHLLISAILLAVYFPNMNVLVAILLVAAAHFLIDWIKIFFEKGMDHYLGTFLLDQAAHLGVLALAASLLGHVPLNVQWEPLRWIYSDYSVVVGLCLLLGVTHVYELTLFQVYRKDGARYMPNYKAMVKRTILWGALYGLFLIFGVYKIVAFGV